MPLKKRLLFVVKGGKTVGMGHLVRMRTMMDNFVSDYDLSVAATTDTYGDSYLKREKIQYFHFQNIPELSAFLKGKSGYDMIISDVYPPGKTLVLCLEKYCDVLICFDDMRTLSGENINATIIYPQETFRKKIETRGEVKFAMGTDYFPIRRNIVEARKNNRFRNQVRNIAIILGGSPPRNQLVQLVTLLKDSVEDNIHLHIVGGYNQNQNNLGTVSSKVSWVYNIDDMGKFIGEMDMGIISGGFIKFEFFCMGTPFAMVSLCAHQEKLGKKFSAEGYGEYWGKIEYCLNHPRSFQKRIRHFIGDKLVRGQLFDRSRMLVDGEGCERLKNMADSLFKGKRIS